MTIPPKKKFFTTHLYSKELKFRKNKQILRPTYVPKLIKLGKNGKFLTYQYNKLLKFVWNYEKFRSNIIISKLLKTQPMSAAHPNLGNF